MFNSNIHMLIDNLSLELPKIYPIRVIDNSLNRAWSLPGLSHLDIIPTFWSILFQIQNDWKTEVEKYSLPLKTDQETLLISTTEISIELEPRYIQCLFSYINFFFTLENGYSVLHSELKGLMHELGLHLPTIKRPKRCPYLEKMHRVRNFTVVHWGGPEKKSDINSAAGRLWGISYKNDPINLLDMEFGYLTLAGAEDRTLKSLRETHKICVDYLKQYDHSCADLLSKIVERLPLTIGFREYSWTKNPKEKST